MTGLLSRVDSWLARNAWLVLALVLAAEALVQWWASMAYWVQEPCDPEAAHCVPGPHPRAAVALFLAQLLGLGGLGAFVLATLRFVPSAATVSSRIRGGLRWAGGLLLLGVGAVLLVLILIGINSGLGGGNEPGGLPLLVQEAAFALLLLGASVNLFPRRRHEPAAVDPPPAA